MSKRNRSKQRNRQKQPMSQRARQQAQLAGTIDRMREDPIKYMGYSRGLASIAGLTLGLIAVGIVFLTDMFLNPPIVYIVNTGAAYVMRYIIAMMYGAGVRFYWTRNTRQGHPDEHDLVTDHRYINAYTATVVTCLATATLALAHDDTPAWMSKWWVITGGTAVIGAATSESLLFFTPMWFYIKILRRYPERSPSQRR